MRKIKQIKSINKVS